MGIAKKVQGFYWHVGCLAGTPAYIREDDGDEPERGTFIQRAITMDHARYMERGESGSCHPCLKGHGDEDKKPSEGKERDFIVLSYELTGALCPCGDVSRDEHNANRTLCEDIWMNAPAMKGAKVPDKLICGDCWYKDNSMPPDERKTLVEAAGCSTCNTPGTEMVVIKAEQPDGLAVDVDEIGDDDDPDQYAVKIRWVRQEEVTVRYEYTLRSIDSDDLEAIRDGYFNDSAYDIASDESDEVNETARVNEGYIDDGPSGVRFEIITK